jgi:hypothetical protein
VAWINLDQDRDHWRALHKEYWESLTGLRQAKGLIQEPSARRTKDLLRLKARVSSGSGTVIQRP